MKFVSICNKIYSKLTGVVVEELQSNTTRLERDVQTYRMDSVHKKQEAERLEAALLREKKNCNTYFNEVSILNGRIEELGKIRRELEKQLKDEKNRPDTVVTERTFVMTTVVYDKFVKSLEPPIVTNNTTAQGAGYLVGMQRVLEKLRSEFVS